MTKKNQELPSSDIITDEEKDKREQSTIATIVRSLVDRKHDEFMQRVTSDLAALDVPDRESVPDIASRSHEFQHLGRIKSPTEPLYRRMSDDERQWRSPDADHYYAEWIRGQVHNDRARMFEASAKLDAMFGRASSEEGVAATGANATGTGGALLPRPLENLVYIARDRVAKMRRFAQVITMTTQQHAVPTAKSMTAAMVAESTTAAQGEPTLSQVYLIARKGQVKAVATDELLADSALNLVNAYAIRAGGALGVLEDNQFFKDGGAAPNVSAILAGTAFSEVTSAALSYTDVLGIYFGVPQAYRSGAVWAVAPGVLQLMSALKDGNGRPFYQGLNEPPMALTDDPGAMGTLLGKPVYEVPFTAGTIHFGDINAGYVVGSRAGITAASSEHINFDLDQVMFKWTERFDGVNVDTSAGQTCTGITSVNTL